MPKHYIYLIIGLLLMVGQNTVYSQDTQMRVVIYDDTEQTVITRQAELWVRGHGSWHYGRGIDYSAVQDITIRPGQRTLIYFYPHGRNGPEIIIPVVYNRNWSSGAAKYALDITITDDRYEVYGLPYNQAEGESSWEIVR